MPKIDLCFQGWLRGVDVTKVTDANGNPKDVSEVSAEDLVQMLTSGECFVSLADSIDEILIG